MAILKVLLDGREIYNLNLAKGREYSVGRAENSDIILNKSSISRQHMKIFFDGQSWQMELVSKFSKFTHEGQEVTNLILTHGQSFILEGYEFRFVDEPEVRKETPAPSTTSATQEPEAPKEPSFEPVLGGNLSPDATKTNVSQSSDSGDRTALATQMAVPCLHSTNEVSGEEVLFTLNGNHWIAGRSSSCQIRLTETKASRQHFELCRTTTGFEIVDLGSSNGTFLNGKKLSPQAKTVVVLGDEIRVGKTVLVFEMRNSKFEEQLAQISHELTEDESDFSAGDEIKPSEDFPAIIEVQNNAPAVIKYEPGVWEAPPKDNRKRNFRVGIGLFIGVLVCFSFFGDNFGEWTGRSKIGPDPLPPNPPTLQPLTGEQKRLAEQTYQLAKTFYIQQKYQSAKVQVEKLHAMVPFYLDSKDMEKYIDEAIEIGKQQEIIDQRLKAAKESADAVKATVRECSSKLNTQTTQEQIQACLQPAMERDPESKEIQALIDKVSAMQNQIQQTKIAKETREGQTRKGLAMFHEAQKSEARSDYVQAIETYNKFANSNLPDPQNNKAHARAAVTALNAKIKSGITQILAKAEQLKSQEKFREAWATLSQAMKWDPSDSRILEAMSAVENELKKRMKALYNDGVLEENIGNLESAKQKWRAIRDQDLKDSEYQRKAASKLKRYGE